MSDFSESDADEGPSSFPLHDAAQAGDVELLRQLLTAAEEAKPSVAELTGLDDALARYAAQAAARQLPDIDQRDHLECTPLHVALLYGQLGAVRALLELGASLQLPLEGSPPLHVAVCVATHRDRQGFALDAIHALLQAGADPYERDDNGRTALHWAAHMDFFPAIEALLEAGVQKRQQLRAELEAARAAAVAAAAAAASDAAAVGGEAPPRPPSAGEVEGEVPPPLGLFQDKHGCTVLHLAARQGHAAAVGLLLHSAAEQGGGGVAAAALAASRNKAGHTALHLAALAGSAAVASLLAAAAPDTVASRTKLGLTPADLADRRRHAALASALRAERPVEALQQLVAAEAGRVKGRAAAAPAARTLLVAPPECLFHFTCPAPITRETSDSAPPENVERLSVLTKPGWGILKGSEFEGRLRWDEAPKRAAIGDVLRVHDWNYVRKIQAVCDSLPDDPEAIGHLDGDTAVSRGTFAAALAAAGATCAAVDAVVTGKVANAFCAVRPPGHHAGPQGVVSNKNDPNGSHGFCLFNNAAVGAAYAMNVYRHAGIARVAILDFDVHHGNGTEACVTNTIPSTAAYKFSTPYSEGMQSFAVWKPWLDSTDTECIFFASVQGYGPKAPGYPAFVYPGSGATCDTKEMAAQQAATAAARGPPGVPEPSGGPAEGGSEGGAGQAAGGGVAPAAMQLDGQAEAERELIEEDPDREFEYNGGQVPPLEGPRIIDVGIPGFGAKPALWRRSWRDKILPALANFKPDLIFVCAGFDAHKKDEINFRYIGVTERDYEWLTEQLVAVANRCCGGRIVSVLEGGYRIQGGVVSAFARSVAAHVKALAEPNAAVWDPADAKAEREHEKRVRAEAEARKKAALAEKAAARDAYLKARLEALAASSAPPPAAASAEAAPAAAADGAAAAAAEAPAVGPAGADDASKPSLPAGEDGEDGGGRRKRRRGEVDYVALNKKLEEEAAARRAAAGGS